MLHCEAYPPPPVTGATGERFQAEPLSSEVARRESFGGWPGVVECSPPHMTASPPPGAGAMSGDSVPTHPAATVLWGPTAPLGATGVWTMSYWLGVGSLA